MREAETAVIRWCEHGENVLAGMSSRSCSGCVNGICGAALACWQPEPDAEPPKPRIRLLPTTQEGWARVVGAVMGLAGFALYGRDLFRHFFT